jgi:hypothetical protein
MSEAYVSSMQDQRYLDRRRTQKLIADLATPKQWTIYFGSGATIDRTGLSWKKLVDRLFSRFEEDSKIRAAVLERNGELSTATMVQALYEERPDGVRELAEDIRRLLYEGHRYMKGRLLDFVLGFATTVALHGQSVTLVTPNYDDYLIYELWRLLNKRTSSTESTLSAQGFELKPIFADDHTSIPIDWYDSKSISCVYLHGFLPRPGLADLIGINFGDKDSTHPDLMRPPIFSEPQYFETYARSLNALSQVFENRNLLLLGTGITDPPLISALLNTKRASQAGLRRLAMIPLQSDQFYYGEPDTPTSSRLYHWNKTRLQELGVEAHYPEFYFQVGQLFHEVQKCIEHGDQKSMLAASSPRRYGSRLESWWDVWFKKNCGTDSSQASHHHLLMTELDNIRSALHAPIDENLKLEAWVRWHPESGRELALWASSVGTWPDIWSIRRDTISTQSTYKSVKVFCNGAPMFLHTDPTSPDRWRTYLATPVWSEDSRGEIPVGVISLASMSEEGSVGEHNLEFLDTVLTRMRLIGREIVAVEDKPREYIVSTGRDKSAGEGLSGHPDQRDSSDGVAILRRRTAFVEQEADNLGSSDSAIPAQPVINPGQSE